MSMFHDDKHKGKMFENIGKMFTCKKDSGKERQDLKK